jgi:hypothetical protein
LIDRLSVSAILRGKLAVVPVVLGVPKMESPMDNRRSPELRKVRRFGGIARGPSLLILASWIMENGRQVQDDAERMRRDAELTL